MISKTPCFSFSEKMCYFQVVFNFDKVVFFKNAISISLTLTKSDQMLQNVYPKEQQFA